MSKINIDDIKPGYTIGNADAAILRDELRELAAYRNAEKINPCVGYVSRKAVIRIINGVSRFCSLYPEPEREYQIPVYLERPLAVDQESSSFDLKKLTRVIVENLVDCGGADISARKQYLNWTEETIRAAISSKNKGM